MDVDRRASDLPELNTPLAESIRETIRAQGPQSFAWFMQQALYHPEYGYYSSGRCTIGRKGDFFTNVSVGPLFGQLLALQFAEIWERLGKINDFVIVEQGAHDGQFARDVLEFARERLPEFFDTLRYRIIEPFPILEERQRQTLEPFRAKVEWGESLQPFTGVHFSNELLDAMPVRLIGDGTEKLVGLDGDNFLFLDQPADTAAFNQAALDWIDLIAANLQRGYVIAIDYGSLEEELERTAQVRAQHRHLDSPLEQVGDADITMSVNWRSIMEEAEAKGLRVTGFTDQHHFLAGIISQFGNGEQGQPFLADSAKARRELQTLLHPEMLGRAFQVLALATNVEIQGPLLAGLKFAPQRGQSD